MALLVWHGVVTAMGATASRHVVVVVWDGMRPDFVSTQNTPVLLGLAHRGVYFQNHHAAYLSSTEVNAAVLATGACPEHTGVIGNEEYRPELDNLRPVRSDAFSTVREADALTGGHYLQRPTLAEIIRQAGGRVVVAGAKPVTLLVDRAARTSAAGGAALFAGVTLPSSFITNLTASCGRFPVSNETNSLRNDWTTRALIDALWVDGVPEFSVLWMNQPDFAQHMTGPGSAAALASLRDLDRNLGEVLRALEAKSVRETTDVLVVSDHGFSTVAAKADLAGDLQKAGFKVSRQFQGDPQPGEILVVSNGGTSFLYVMGHDRKVIRAAVTFLQGWPFAGVICTRKSMPGTFTLEQCSVAAQSPPDIMVSLRWSAGRSANGTAGLTASDGGYGPGQGTHGSFSPFEMHNLMIAAGPDFRAGMVDALPTGNIDVAPTVLWLLGIKPAPKMDGRVLTEALRKPGPRLNRLEPRRLEAKRKLAGTMWLQYLNLVKLNGVVYYDEGNGSQTRK